MSNHPEMFPMSEEERIGLLRSNLASDVEKRLAKRDTAAVALADAQELEDVARGLLSVFDSMVRERASRHTGSAMDAAVELKRNAEKAGIGLSFSVNGEPPIVIAEAPAVDPIAGEVASVPVADWECPGCGGQGRIPDKTGGGHHRCKDCNGTGHAEPSCDNCTGYGDCNISQRLGSDTMGCGGRSWLHGESLPDVDPITAEGLEAITGVVRVLYPGEAARHAHITDVGSRTQYGELVADYLATLPAVSGRRDDPVAYYRVIGVDDEIDRDLRGPVSADDYGVELAVVRLVDVQEAKLLEDAVR